MALQKVHEEERRRKNCPIGQEIELAIKGPNRQRNSLTQSRPKDGPAQRAKSKLADADREKYAAAERTKKAKSGVEPAVAKTDVTKRTAAKTDPVIAANAKTAVPSSEKSRTDEDLDDFLAQVETPFEAPKQTAAKKTRTGNPEQSSDAMGQSKRDVVQVKKEVAKDEGDAADWDSIMPASKRSQQSHKSMNESRSDDCQPGGRH